MLIILLKQIQIKETLQNTNQELLLNKKKMGSRICGCENCENKPKELTETDVCKNNIKINIFY